MQKARCPELDFVRVVAMFAVIVIHTTSGYIFADSGVAMGGINLAFLLNQAARFAVPLFILLSGTSFALKYGNTRSADGFYRRSLPKILIPYIFWACLYYVLRVTRYGAGAQTIGSVPLTELVKGFLLGRFASHLYFIVVLTQCYILFPLLRRLIRRFPVPALITCFTLTVAYQWCLALQPYGLVLPAIIRDYGWLSFPSYIFFFALGLCADRERLELVIRAAAKSPALCLAAALFFAWLLATDSLLTLSHESSLKPQIIIYTLLIAFVLVGLARKVLTISQSEQPKLLSRAVGFISRRSFTVYFVHVLFIEELRRLSIDFPGMSGMSLLTLLVAGLSILIACPIDAVTHKLTVFLMPKRRGNEKTR